MSFVEPSVERRSLRLFKQRTVGEPTTSVWHTVSNSLFYVVVLVAVGVFVYYLYTFERGKGLVTLYLPVLLDGAKVTIIVSILSMVLATIFGFIGALGRLSHFVPIRWLATVYVEVVRGTPILVQLLLWYYGIGYVLSTIGVDPYSAVFQIMTALQNNSLVPDQFNAYFYGIICGSSHQFPNKTERANARCLKIGV
jgi:His/Glu/Gln/Arg/opine family amino acid ABC transporter permease subunit